VVLEPELLWSTELCPVPVALGAAVPLLLEGVDAVVFWSIEL